MWIQEEDLLVEISCCNLAGGEGRKSSCPAGRKYSFWPTPPGPCSFGQEEHKQWDLSLEGLTNGLSKENIHEQVMKEKHHPKDPGWANVGPHRATSLYKSIFV